MENNFSGTATELSSTEPQPAKRPRSTQALVHWQLLADVGAALVVTADMPADIALDMLPSLLDRITHPHRVLELLDADVDGVLAGDALAAGRLYALLSTLAKSYPELIGSCIRAKAIVQASGDDSHDWADEGTVPFDGLVRLGAAAAMATLDSSATALDSALDLILGLAMLTAAADRLVKGHANNGPSGVAEAFNMLKLLGHWSVITPALMRTMSGALGGIPGALPGVHVPDSGPFGGPLSRLTSPDEISGTVNKIVDRLRDRRRWDSTIWDGRPPWREIVGLPPVEVIDHDEIRRVGCLLELTRALKLRQEPPPPRPAIVVWSDTITGITPNNGCAGDQIVISGSDFGLPDANIGVMLPMADGCHAFAVPAADWTPTAITITLPTGIVSGTVGLVNLDYVRVYDEWATRMNELTKSIIENAKCSRSKAPDVTYVPLLRTCPPLTGFNYLRAGMPVIQSFKANGADLAFVEPGQGVRLEWDLRNVDHFQLKHLPGDGPQFATTQFVDDPPGNQYDLGPFIGVRPKEATYELRAEGPCGSVTASVKVRLRKIPVLEIEGIEITQAIQTFRDPESPPNTIPLVAHKDTIVRVYVAVENLGGFQGDRVEVSGRLQVIGTDFSTILPPLTPSVTAQPRAKIDRTKADDTLNFRIPAALASSTSSTYTTLAVNVWTTDQVEAPPTGVKTRPTTYANRFIKWVEKRPFKVRYVRISLDDRAALSDAEAREQIIRAFDLLPTVPTDLAPARLATWHTSQNINTQDGLHTLLGHIDDQHNCTFSEWLFPWEDECPDADGAVWLGILPRVVEGTPGATYVPSFGDFNGKNTAIVSPVQKTIVHELGHTLGLRHVRTQLGCGPLPIEQQLWGLAGNLDPLPNDGAIRIGDAFDSFTVSVVKEYGGLYDFMTYWCETWVSRDNWMRLFNIF